MILKCRNGRCYGNNGEWFRLEIELPGYPVWYIPAATAFLDRSANKGIKGKQLTDMMGTLKQKWNSLRFGEIKIITAENQHKFYVEVFYGS
jgi:hypothetical protein